MPMWIILGVCAAVFILVIAFAGAKGAFDGGMSDEEADVPPAQRLTDDAGTADIAALRFTPTLWGYRPAEVDDALARLQARIAVQDARLAALGEPVTGQLTTPGAAASENARPGAGDDARPERRETTDLSTDAPTGRGTDVSTGPSQPTGSGTATFINDL